MGVRSLQRQILLAILLAEICCAAAFTGLALVHEWRVRIHALDTALRGRADSLLGAIQDAEDANDNVTVDPSELEVPAADVYAVYNQDGRLLGTSAAAPASIIARQRDGTSTRQDQHTTYRVLQRQGIRIIDRPENGGVGLRRPVTIIYAIATGHLWREIFRATGFYLLLGLVFVFASAAAIVVLLRRIFVPIDELAAEASRLSLQSLTFRPPARALALSELRPLGETLSSTVESLRRSIEQQRRFVGDATHELKTSVAVVRSSIELLLLRPRGAKEYEDGLRIALKDHRRVEELISRMLVSARFEEQALGRERRSQQRSDLGDATRRTADRLLSFASAHEIRLQVESLPTAWVTLSPDEADVLVSSLLMNALQHTAARACVSVCLSNTDRHTTLLVADEGHGIPADALPFVFDRFFRVDSARSRDSGGAGLGLAICKSMVDAAAGTITISSEPGKGTAVRVVLPLASAPSAELKLRDAN